MSKDTDQRPPKKLSKIERERELYAKLGMQHPKDAVLDLGLKMFRAIAEKQRSRQPLVKLDE